MAFAPGTDYYEILGVEPDATTEEIKRAYRKLTPLTHPDTGVSTGLFRLITEARDCLVDPDRRADYDRDRVAGSSAPPPWPRASQRPSPPPPPQPSPPRSAPTPPPPGPAQDQAYQASDNPPPGAGRLVRGRLRAELRELGWKRALAWSAVLGATLAVLTAIRIAVLPVPDTLPAAPALTLGDWGGTGGRIGLSTFVAAAVAPGAAVWWAGHRYRIRLALGLAAIPVAEFVVAGVVAVTAALVIVWLARAAWRLVLWTYWAP